MKESESGGSLDPPGDMEVLLVLAADNDAFPFPFPLVLELDLSTDERCSGSGLLEEFG